MGRKQDDITGKRVEAGSLVGGRSPEGAAGGAPGGISRRPRPLKDWIGRTFGSLTVVAYDGKRGGKHYWRCRCLCGGEAIVCQSNLKSGHTRSCGCLSDPAGTRHFVEGTCIESIRSRKVSASNSSGIRGVYRNRRTGRWAAQITFQGRTRYLGSFGSLEEAAAAREQAEKEMFDGFLEQYGGARQAPGLEPATRTGLERKAGGEAVAIPAELHRKAAVMAFGGLQPESPSMAGFGNRQEGQDSSVPEGSNASYRDRIAAEPSTAERKKGRAAAMAEGVYADRADSVDGIAGAIAGGVHGKEG